MARILDVTPKNSPKRTDRGPHLARSLTNDETSPEDSGVPYVEVGAGVATPHPRISQRDTEATIIPMTQSRVAEVSAAEPPSRPSIFRIAFQTLPFPGSPTVSPAERYAPELVVFHDPAHEVSEQYRRVFAQIEKQLTTAASRSLLFTSAMRNAGTTSVMLNLSLAGVAHSKAPILVVDANFDHPGISSRLGIPAEPGLREVLARAVPLAWAIRESGVPNLSVLPAGTPSTPVVLDLWPIVLDQLMRQFPWVLIDGPLFGTHDAPAFASTATAMYFVLQQIDLERPELNQLLFGLSRSSSNLRGYILTQH
jgi:Mrp family chromosome partitioning ATPase